MRWRNRVLGSIAAAAALTTTGLALAAPSPESLQRSVETFTEWTGGPQHDMQDPGHGYYQFEAQVEGGARRAVDSAGSRYTPDRVTNPDDLRVELQVLYDGVLHDRPNPPDNGLQETPDPDLLPDWNGNSIYGEAGSGLDHRGDYDLDIDQHRDAAWFRYPTFHDDGTVSHGGGQGAAVEAGFINSRGLFIDATVWLPGDMVASVDAGNDVVTLQPELTSHPALVFSNGVSSSQIMYYWFAESMAARGYIVLTYDPAGQGQSEGTWTDTFQQSPAVGDCYFGGACLDVRDAVRWLVGDPISSEFRGLENGQVRPFSGPKDSAYDPATNPRNPVAGLVDRSRVGLAGNSMGALATLNYLTALEEDGSTLPPLKAAVVMSGATASAVGSVPLQLQTSDFDGSPTLVGPGVGGVNLGGEGQGIGYYVIKDMFDRLRPTATNPMSLVVMEGGVHTDHTRVPYVPRTLWATRVASQYAGDWFDCHIDSADAACTRAGSSTQHLSKAFGSESFSPATGSSQTSWRCIGIDPPSEMSLNYDAQDLAALRPRDCLGRAGAGNG